MGGQACILYGAAEFSRDLDLSISIAPENLALLKEALNLLQADQIFFPNLATPALNRGHACHFRCHIPEAKGLRIDLLAKMRGCSDFEKLYERRAIVNLPEIGEVSLLSLTDLVQSKKTQREKDWHMIRRLIETDILQFHNKPDENKVRFWLKECRTPSHLISLASDYPALFQEVLGIRPLLEFAWKKDLNELEERLKMEENLEKEKDREYWLPLKRELEKWRMERHYKEG
jgi:hypothetical protein